MSAAGWAAELGVDTRTIQRDLAYLRRHEQMPIVYDKELGGYRCESHKSFGMSETRAKKWTRLMALIHRIAAEPGQSSQQLADAMGCTPRTIFRDVRELEDIGLPLYSDGGYRFAADGFLPRLALTPQELLALFLGARMLESVGAQELAPHARGGLEKLLRATGEQGRPDVGAWRSQVQVSEMPEDTGVDQLLPLQAVIGNGRQLRLHYRGMKDTSVRVRIVDPLGLMCFRQVWYLHAYDPQEQGTRNFRLSRLEGWESLPTPAQHTARMDLADAVYHRWDVEGDARVTVELRVTDKLARWLEENPPHPSQKIDGQRVLYEVSDLVAVSRWVSSLHGLEVVAPPRLRQEMARRAEELQSLYREA